jgi:hypothetical protein
MSTLCCKYLAKNWNYFFQPFPYSQLFLYWLGSSIVSTVIQGYSLGGCVHYQPPPTPTTYVRISTSWSGCTMYCSSSFSCPRCPSHLHQPLPPYALFYPQRPISSSLTPRTCPPLSLLLKFKTDDVFKLDPLNYMWSFLYRAPLLIDPLHLYISRFNLCTVHVAPTNPVKPL